MSAAPAPVRVWQKTGGGTLAEIQHFALWIDRVGCEALLSQDCVFALQVCAEELLTNIAKYARQAVVAADPKPDGAGFAVLVTLLVGSQAVRMTVEDNGPPFDLAAAVPHRIEGPIDEVQVGGLGVQLIHSFAKRLEYRRAGLGNHVELEFDREPAAASTSATAANP